MTRIRSLIFSAVFLMALADATCSRLSAAESTLWQIGQFDHSSEEFGPSFSILPTGLPPDPVVDVDKSDWKKEWVAFHPGSSNGLAGGRKHPFTITFKLDHRPIGTYTLILSTLHYMQQRPHLEIDLNAHRGVYYFQPQISYDPGEFSVAFIPHFGYQQLAIDFPPGYLVQGENRLVLTCVDEPETVNQSNGSIAPGISGLHYDALKFTEDTKKRFLPKTIQATVSPTIFYKQKDKQLFEQVEVLIRLNQKITGGQVNLDFQGKRYTERLSPNPNIGEQKIVFGIPEWEGSKPARLKVTAGATRLFDCMLAPERKWKLFVAPHTHLDVGYTDYQGKVAELQARVLSQAIDLFKQNPEFRYSLDGSWVLEQFLATRPVDRQKELLRLLQEGKMALPGQYFNLLTGIASAETLFRSLYYSKNLARIHHFPVTYANITDVPSQSGSYASILASSGIRYFASGGNNWRAPFLLNGLWNEKSPFWWEGPDGKKVLFWYSRHYMQIQNMFGLPPQSAAIRDSLPVFLQAYSKAQYKPDGVLLFGTQVENTDLYPETATFIDGWNRDYAYPQLEYKTLPEFLKYLDENFGSQLPTYRGDGGPFWEDGAGSDSFYVAEDRHNQQRVLSAEILSNLNQMMDPELAAPKALVEDVWRNLLLFAEHTWTAWISIPMPDHEQSKRQLETKDNRAVQARQEIDEWLQRSMSQLGNLLHVPSSTLVVFNSLNYRRSCLVEADLFSESARIQDLSTGKEVPFEILWTKQGFSRIRFMAEDLPSVGYKCYSVLPSPNRPIASTVLAGSQSENAGNVTVENPYYRLVLDPPTGSVSSIYDKELGQELVDLKSPHKFNQYLVVSGGDGSTRIIRPITSWPAPSLEIHGAEHGKVLGVFKTSYGHSIKLRSTALNTPEIQTEILLFDREKKIEFINRIDKKEVVAKEAVYFAFPTAVVDPEFLYATQNGWVNPARDLLQGACLEWFSVQQWMAVRNPQITIGLVPIDAPLASFGDINRGSWPLVFQPKTSTLFSYVMNNYWDTNYRAAQGGAFTFRYVLTSSRKFVPEELSRLGWSHLRAAELNAVMPQEKVGNPDRPLPPEGASFLESDAVNVILLTWKVAEDQQGNILRLLETSGKQTTATLRLPRWNLKSAELTDGVEENLNHPLTISHNAFEVTLRPNEIVTVRIQKGSPGM
ncbi:MAG: polysaccharide lyase family protein [Terriglobia bacterium]